MLCAVQVIHEESIVHSDLKPANFVVVKGRVKLIDFGISKAIAADTTNIGRDQQIGTANYMPPEALLDTGLGDDGKRLMKVSSRSTRFYQMTLLTSYRPVSSSVDLQTSGNSVVSCINSSMANNLSHTSETSPPRSL